MVTIGILEYGVGNIGSVVNAITYLGHSAVRVYTPEAIQTCTALIVPGQGAMGAGMAHLTTNGLDQAIREYVANGNPYFGICLGYQLLFDWSEEDGGVNGLGILSGQVRRFDSTQVKVPQMGWNRVEPHQDPHGYWPAPLVPAFVYFAHSYYVTPTDSSVILGTTTHGVTYASMVGTPQLLGCQFHPEKSGQWGLLLLQNWIHHHVRSH